MSKFFKALKQAEADRAREEHQSSSSPPSFAKEPTIWRATPRAEVAVVVPSDDGPAASPEVAPTVVAQPSAKPSTEEVRAADRWKGISSACSRRHRSRRSNTEPFVRCSKPSAAKRDLLVLAVSSPGVGDGKTTTAINLAGVLAEADEPRVLLLDADLRNPSVGLKLGLERSRGRVGRGASPSLGEARRLITRRTPLPDRPGARRGEHDGPLRAAEVESRSRNCSNETRRVYDFVILDTPPIVSLARLPPAGDSCGWLHYRRRSRRTPRKLVEEALNSLDPDKVLGFIFNNDREMISRYGSYYGYNGVRCEPLEG